MTTTALPSRARSTSACRISRAAPASTPQVGWSTTRSFGRRIDLAPDDEFLQVAAGQFARLRVGFRHAHVEALHNGARDAACRVEHDEARTADLAGRVMRDQGVLAQAMGRRGGMAEALFRHERRAEAPPGVDAVTCRTARPAMMIASDRSSGAPRKGRRKARSGHFPRRRRSRPLRRHAPQDRSPEGFAVQGRGRQRRDLHESAACLRPPQARRCRSPRRPRCRP